MSFGLRKGIAFIENVSHCENLISRKSLNYKTPVVVLLENIMGVSRLIWQMNLVKKAKSSACANIELSRRFYKQLSHLLMNKNTPLEDHIKIVPTPTSPSAKHLANGKRRHIESRLKDGLTKRE